MVGAGKFWVLVRFYRLANSVVLGILGAISGLRHLSLGFADGKRLRLLLLSLEEICWDLARLFSGNALGFEFLDGSSLDSFN